MTVEGGGEGDDEEFGMEGKRNWESEREY